MDPNVTVNSNTVLIVILIAIVATFFGVVNDGHFLFFD